MTSYLVTVTLIPLFLAPAWMLLRRLGKPGRWWLLVLLVATQALFRFLSDRLDAMGGNIGIELIVWVYGRCVIQWGVVIVIMPLLVEEMDLGTLFCADAPVHGRWIAAAAGIGLCLAAIRFPLLPHLRFSVPAPWDIILSIIVVRAATRALVEEVFFRGYLWHQLSCITGRSPDAVNVYQSIACAAIAPISPYGPHHVVALVHRIGMAFITAYAMGWLRKRSGSLVPGWTAKLSMYIPYGVASSVLEVGGGGSGR